MGFINYEVDYCKGCGDPKLIVYKAGRLCDGCNNKRKREVYSERQNDRAKFNDKAIKQMQDDVKMYEKIWDEREPHCQECGKHLGNYTAQEAAKWHKEYFSHILPKGLYGKIRHVLENVNLLCLDHHQMWENRATQKKMKIWKKNKPLMIKLMKKYGYSG